MSAKLARPCEVYRCTSSEQLKELLSNNFGRVFQIYVTVNITVHNTAIPPWTLFNVQMPSGNDVFEAAGINVISGETYILYGTSLENMKVTQI